MNNEERKKQADMFLYEMGLFEKLTKYGESHIIGRVMSGVVMYNIGIVIVDQHAAF